MTRPSLARRCTDIGGIFLAIFVVFPSHGAASRELDRAEVERKSDTPVSPETKKRQNGYDAAVRQCQSQSGPAKQECVETAKLKYGEMLK